MSGSSYTNVFGGTTVRPASPSYEAITMASSTVLRWPLETTPGTPVVAALMDVTASASSLYLAMPPGNTGSSGVIAYVANVGSNSFEVRANDESTVIATIATTQTWMLALTDNSTTNGTWRAYQLASTTSSASAASLAGQGLEANGSLLQTDFPITYLTGNTNLTPSYRGESIVWLGTTGTLQLNDIDVLGDGWFCLVANYGSGVLTISTTSSELINGAATLSMNPGNSGILVAGATTFNSFGALVGALSVINGGTGATTADAALTNLGGTSIGKSIFTAPNAAAVVALLGLNDIEWVESTVAINQTVTAGSNRRAFVATAAINFNLPLTSSVDTSFFIQVYAQNGVVTVTPNAAETINGGAVGAPYTIPSKGCAQFVTDGAGAWWTVFGPELSGTTLTTTGAGTIGTNLNVGGTLAATGAITGSELTTTGTITAGTSLKATTSLIVGTNITAGGTLSGVTSLAMGGALTGATTGAFSGAVTAANGASSTQVVNYSQFNPTLAATGKISLPGGLIVQWGVATGDASGDAPVTFATTFSVIYGVNATRVTNSIGNVGAPYITVPSTSAFTLRCYPQVASAQYYWIAWGI